MADQFFECRAIGGTITLFGTLSLRGFPGFLSKAFQVIRQAGYRDVTIDMSDISSIYPSVIPPLASHITYLRQEYKADFFLKEPKNVGARTRLRSSGLGYYIDPRKYEKPGKKDAYGQALGFRTGDQQQQAIDSILNSALRKLQMSRSQLKAVEWALSEITENVMGHSQSKVGGIVISSKIPHKNIIEFCVADSGIGIARTLEMTDECQALEKAIQEGVTRNKSTNQGNGLYGTFRLAQVSSGMFTLKSFGATLYVDKNGAVRNHEEKVPFRGTYLVCQIDCDSEDLIRRALVFNGRAHDPAYDYLEKMHENKDKNAIIIKAHDICKTFGSRPSGIEARNYIRNMIASYPSQKLDIDLNDVNIISSSFADEAFGKLFVELGPMRYIRTITISNTCSEVEAIIDGAISKRAQTGL